jgi:hypothetical protein
MTSVSTDVSYTWLEWVGVWHLSTQRGTSKIWVTGYQKTTRNNISTDKDRCVLTFGTLYDVHPLLRSKFAAQIMLSQLTYIADSGSFFVNPKDDFNTQSVSLLYWRMVACLLLIYIYASKTKIFATVISTFTLPSFDLSTRLINSLPPKLMHCSR